MYEGSLCRPLPPSHLPFQVAGSTSKADFACGLIRGLGGNLSLADRASFAKEVSGNLNPKWHVELNVFQSFA